MILKEHFVISEKSWGSRNLEFIFDIIFLITVTCISIFFVILNPKSLALPYLSLMIFGFLFSYFERKKFHYSYTLSFLLEAEMAFLIMPSSWLVHWLVVFSSLLSWGLFFYFRFSFNLRVPLLFYLITIQGTLLFLTSSLSDTALEWSHFGAWIPNWQPCQPNIMGCQSTWESIWNQLSWLGGFPFCIALLCRWLVYPIGLLFLGWFFWLFSIQYETYLFLESIQYSGMLFALYLLPGKNRYYYWLGSFISFWIVFFISWLVFTGKYTLEFYIFLFMGLFFVLESLFSILFYGIKRRK